MKIRDYPRRTFLLILLLGLVSRGFGWCICIIMGFRAHAHQEMLIGMAGLLFLGACICAFYETTNDTEQ